MCFICCGSVSDLWWQCDSVTVWQCDTHQECLHHVSVLPLVSWLGLPLIALASVLQSRQRFRVLLQYVTECCHYVCVWWCCDEQSGAGTEDESETWEGGGEGEGTTYTVDTHQPIMHYETPRQTSPQPEDMCFYYFQTTLNPSDFIHTTILTSALILVIFF